jgi:hypothetical protein
VLRFLTDENFRSAIVRGLLRRLPQLDLVRVQAVGLSGADDPTILAWAAAEGRVLLTHDVATIPSFAYQRLAAGLPMAGVFVLPRRLPTGRAIEELLVLAGASLEGEWEGRVGHLPL